MFTTCQILIFLTISGLGFFDEQGKVAKDAKTTIALKVDFGDLDKKPLIFQGIKWREKQTVLELMTAISKDKKNDFKFKYSGKGSTAFLKSIQSVNNKGAGGANWIYRVNEKLGDRSFGTKVLKPGDKVTWKFQKFQFKK